MLSLRMETLMGEHWRTRLPPDVPGTLAALGKDNRFGVVLYLDHVRRATFSELKAVTGLESGAISPLLAKLQHAGLVRKVATGTMEGIRSAYEPTTLGSRLLAALDRVYSGDLRATSSSRVEVVNWGHMAPSDCITPGTNAGTRWSVIE